MRSVLILNASNLCSYTSSGETCERDFWSKDLCSIHYARWVNIGRPSDITDGMLGPVGSLDGRTEPCQISKCENFASRRFYLCKKHYDLKYRYNASVREIEIYENSTNCSICSKTFDGNNTQRRNLKCFDHCHVTGAFRGVICNNCNVGLGKIGEDSETLFRAAEYVRNPKIIPKFFYNLRTWTKSNPGICKCGRGAITAQSGQCNKCRGRKRKDYNPYRANSGILDPNRWDVATTEKYLLNTQQSVCPITLNPIDLENSDFDHDHSTMMIRGLLPRDVNRGLGYFGDREDLLLNAACYLKTFEGGG